VEKQKKKSPESTDALILLEEVIELRANSDKIRGQRGDSEKEESPLTYPTGYPTTPALFRVVERST